MQMFLCLGDKVRLVSIVVGLHIILIKPPHLVETCLS